MLISCTSCQSKYLINSADLKPEGRTVKCANCGNQWYQESVNNAAEEILNQSAPSTSKIKSEIDELSLPIPNLPSTYVKEQKVSVLNSILVILFTIILIVGFWVFRKTEMNTLVLLKFYINEFYFNLNLIISDIANIIFQIIN